jgi:hypothetical protein
LVGASRTVSRFEAAAERPDEATHRRYCALAPTEELRERVVEAYEALPAPPQRHAAPVRRSPRSGTAAPPDLGELEAAGLAAGSEEGNGRARYWSPLLPTTAPVGERVGPDARAAACRAGVGHRRLLPPCNTALCPSAPSSNAAPRGSGRWPSASTGQGGVGAPRAPSSTWRRSSPIASATGRSQLSPGWQASSTPPGPWRSWRTRSEPVRPTSGASPSRPRRPSRGRWARQNSNGDHALAGLLGVL